MAAVVAGGTRHQEQRLQLQQLCRCLLLGLQRLAVAAKVLLWVHLAGLKKAACSG
jgi:hypothetical protein